MIIKIVEFCDEYSSALSLLVSVVAIFISIRIAYLPYKKKALIKFNKSYIITETGHKVLYGYNLTVTNIGHRPIVINLMGLCFADSVYLSKDSTPANEMMYLCKLMEGECFSCRFSGNDIKRKMEKLNLEDNISVYCFFDDSEEKRYKKYICIVGQLKSISFF